MPDFMTNFAYSKIHNLGCVSASTKHLSVSLLQTFMAPQNISVTRVTTLLLETVQYGCKANPAPALGKYPPQYLSGVYSVADKYPGLENDQSQPTRATADDC